MGGSGGMSDGLSGEKFRLFLESELEIRNNFLDKKIKKVLAIIKKIW